MKVARACKPCAYRMAWVLLREQGLYLATTTCKLHAFASSMPGSPYESPVAKRARGGAKCRVISCEVTRDVAKRGNRQGACHSTKSTSYVWHKPCNLAAPTAKTTGGESDAVPDFGLATHLRFRCLSVPGQSLERSLSWTTMYLQSVCFGELLLPYSPTWEYALS